MVKRERLFPVVDIFGPVTQGEGMMIGVKTHFVRFGGCDYRCKMCDTLYAVLPEEVKKRRQMMTAHDIEDQLASIGCEGPGWVTFSGGNPALFELGRLIRDLHDEDIKVAVETQGSVYKEWFKEVDCLTLSPKAPGMGEKYEKNKFVHILDELSPSGYLPKGVNIKVVVFDEQDILFAREIAYTMGNYRWSENFTISVGNALPPHLASKHWTGGAMGIELLRETCLERYKEIEEILYKKHPQLSYARLLPQLHVLVHGNAESK